MKKRLFIAFIILLFFSTYQKPKYFNIDYTFKIKKILIENNNILDEERIKNSLTYLYDKNLFFLKEKEIENKLKNLQLIESFEIKKIYPHKIKIKVFEKKPIAILQNKKEKNFYTSNGDMINFFDLEEFQSLPLVYGDKESFKKFYDNLLKFNYPINEIKSFYLFESKRWDFITNKGQLIKLPVNNYKQSLENFLNIKDKANFDKYKIFDYRINDQLILK